MDNKAIERIIERQAKANARVLKQIGEILGKIGELTPSEAYTIAKQLKYGESLKNIVKTLSKYSKINEIDIYKMLEAEAKVNLDLKKIYYKAKNIDFIPYKNNMPLKNLVRQVAMSTLNTYRNISATTGLTYLDRLGNPITKSIEQAYWEIIDNAILDINMGKESFESALQKQLQTIGEAGIQSIEYQTGYHRRIDSAIRMNLQTGLTELFEKEQEMLGNQFDYDGWEISVHENPAEDHEEVQGHQFTIIEYEKLQNFGIAKDVNGILIDIHNKYGDFRPIGELNCYHEAITIIVGVSKPKYTQEELDKIIEKNNKGFEYNGKHYTNYQGIQLQRKLETEIRKAKESQIIAKAGNKPDLIQKEENRINILTNKYYELSKASNLPTKLERMQVSGYKKVKIEKKNYYKDATQEWLENATPNSHKVLDRNFYISENGTRYNVDNKNVVLDYTKEEKNTAIWLENKFGGEIYMNPRINNPEGIESADYFYRNNNWDRKALERASSKTRAIDNAIKNHKEQAKRFVLDITNCKLTNEEIIEQAKNVFTPNKFNRNWVECIIIKRNDEIIKIFEKE